MTDLNDPVANIRAAAAYVQAKYAANPPAWAQPPPSTGDAGIDAAVGRHRQRMGWPPAHSNCRGVMPSGGATLKPGIAGAMFAAALGREARRYRLWPLNVWISRPWQSETKPVGKPVQMNPPAPGGQATVSQQMTFTYQRGWMLYRRGLGGDTLEVNSDTLRQLAQLTVLSWRTHRAAVVEPKKRVRRLQLANTVAWSAAAILAFHPGFAAFDASLAVFSFSRWLR